MVGVIFVLLMIAGGVFVLGYLCGRDAADAATAIQAEALERAQRIHAATYEAARQITTAAQE